MDAVVKISQKAANELASLPVEVRAKVRRAVGFLDSGNEKSVKPKKLQGGRNLYSGVINSRYRLIYSKRKNEIIIVDIVSIDTVAHVMRSES